MSKKSSLLALAIAATLSAGVASAAALTINLPAETTVYKPSTLPGYDLVQRNCMTCHSAQYVASQPPTMGRAYWDATVKKMKKPFGASFADADIAAMVDYLTKTYGAEAAPAAAAVTTSTAVMVQK